MSKCSEPAELIVTWANKEGNYCRYHATGLVKLGDLLGSPVPVRKIIGTDSCASEGKFTDEEKASIDEQLASQSAQSGL